MSPATPIRVERLAAAFDDLIPADVSAEVLADFGSVAGPHWLEGPAWDRAQRLPLIFRCQRQRDIPMGPAGRRTAIHAAERLHRT